MRSRLARPALRTADLGHRPPLPLHHLEAVVIRLDRRSIGPALLIVACGVATAVCSITAGVDDYLTRKVTRHGFVL